MNVMELEPKKVFRFFHEISRIPHGSGNTKAIEQYCLDFAEVRGIESYRDEYGNVMLFKPASAGYELHEPVILQGHLDMVCEKDANCPINMDKDPIELETDGEKLWAKGTSLGADDGIAIAFILAVLDSENIKHPPIEALFTVDEEVGLIGANNLDASKLRGRRLINIDSEEEGILTVSCAGASRVDCEIPISDGEAKGKLFIEITISGLLGGHSGVEINMGRKNACKVLGDLLDHIREKDEFSIVSIHGGGRLNVIPQTATAIICAEEAVGRSIYTSILEYDEILSKECEVVEPDVHIAAKYAQPAERATDSKGTDKIIFTLLQFPHGVYAMSPNIKELVQTSSNLGFLAYENGKLSIGTMIRSNTDYGKIRIRRRVARLVDYLEGTWTIDTDYPAWEYLHISPLRDLMIKAYEDLYGEMPVISAMHAGLECGIIAEKIPGADLISFGPTMKNVHSPQEELDVHSTERSFRYLVHVLEKL